MNIHWLQHVPFEGLGRIENWALENGHRVTCTRLFAGEPLPRQDEFQMLVVMGGPMGVHDDEKCDWLHREKEFIQASIQAKKPILGVCLGAQLLALVLGAEVVANEEKEIGWYPVARTKAVPEGILDILPEELRVFHWHGDTFSLPDHSVRLYASSACMNQAFLYGDRVMGLQFHLETTPDGVEQLSENCRDELVDGRWIQSEETLLAVGRKEFETMDNALAGMMKYLMSRVEKE